MKCNLQKKFYYATAVIKENIMINLYEFNNLKKNIYFNSLFDYSVFIIICYFYLIDGS